MYVGKDVGRWVVRKGGREVGSAAKIDRSAAELFVGTMESTLQSAFEPDPHEVRSLRTKVRCHGRHARRAGGHGVL